MNNLFPQETDIVTPRTLMLQEMLESYQKGEIDEIPEELRKEIQSRFLRFAKVNPDRPTKMPTKGTIYSAGWDISFNPENESSVTIKGGEHMLLETNIKMAIPIGNVGLLFARSGMSTKRNLGLKNMVGVIDSDFRGELKVALWNTGKEDQVVEPGERIAQLVIMPYAFGMQSYETTELDDTERGEGGFGSTGTK